MIPLRPNIALAVMLASMSDQALLNAYLAASQTKDTLARALGDELLRRLHQADPEHFPLPTPRKLQS